MKLNNVFSAFDGMSNGQLALHRANIEYANYYASEIDKYATAVTQHNYPNTIQLGDITKIKGSDLPKIDLLIGGSPCFVAGTKVITSDQYKNIEEVQIGDIVLTHRNRRRKVLAIGDTIKPVVEVVVQGTKPTHVTSNHPYFVRKMYRKWDNNRRTDYRHFDEPTWKEAGQLVKGDFVGFPILQASENPLGITLDEAWIIGRYIADGHTRKDYRVSAGRPNDRHWQLILSIGDKKVNSVKSRLEGIPFSCYPHTKSTHRVVLSSKHLVNLVGEHCGSGSENKHLSMTLLNLPVHLLAEVLEGYLSGDGSNSKGVYQATSVSEELILNLNIAIAKVYQVNSGYSFCERPRTTVIEGRTVNQRDTYLTAFRKTMKKQSQAIVEDNIIWLPVRSVTSVEGLYKVYNLEVEEDNSYTANNLIVHNCQSFSMAGKRKGMITKDNVEVLNLEQYLELKASGFEFEGQSYLFWEYVRLLVELKPRYFLLENVRMAKKWKIILTETLIKYANMPDDWGPILINSALVSAQNRRRLYWTNIPNVTQPEDRGILLKDILESNVTTEGALSKGRKAWLASISGIKSINKGYTSLDPPKAQCLTARGEASWNCNYVSEKSTPINGCNLAGHTTNIKGYDIIKRVYSPEGKSPTLTTCTGGHREPKVAIQSGELIEKKDNCYTPLDKHNSLNGLLCVGGGTAGKSVLIADKEPTILGGAIRGRSDTNGKYIQQLECNNTSKANSLTTVQKDSLVLVQGEKPTELVSVVHEAMCSKEGKAHCITASYGGAVPYDSLKKHRKSMVAMIQVPRGNNQGGLRALDGKTPVLTASSWEHNNHVGEVSSASIVGRRINDRGVRDDNNKDVPINQCLQVNADSNKSRCLTTVEKDCLVSELPHGRYKDAYTELKENFHWRKLTVKECERLQTVPDNYTFAYWIKKNKSGDQRKVVSNSQRYKMLGNGFTVDVIAHILKGLKEPKIVRKSRKVNNEII